MAKIVATTSIVQLANNAESLKAGVFTGHDYIALYADGRCCKPGVVMALSVLRLTENHVHVVLYDSCCGLPEEFLAMHEVFGCRLCRVAE